MAQEDNDYKTAVDKWNADIEAIKKQEDDAVLAKASKSQLKKIRPRFTMNSMNTLRLTIDRDMKAGNKT